MHGRHLGSLFLALLLVVSPAAVSSGNSYQHVSLAPTDSAYVVANLKDNGTDPLGFRSLNTGALSITKVWYAWNLTEVDRTTGKTIGYIPVEIVSFAYMKFNLSQFAGLEITNATLRLYAIQSNLTESIRYLVAYHVTNNSWSQSTLTFNNAPGFDKNDNSTTPVDNGVGGWYGFDLKKMAQSRAGGELSVAIAFLVLYQHSEEQVVFNSPRAVTDQPYLYVAVSPFPGPFTSPASFFETSLVSYVWLPPGVLAALAAASLIIGYYLFQKRRLAADDEARLKRG